MTGKNFERNMSLNIPNLVPKRPFCYLNFTSVAEPQKFGNETYDAHVLASSKTYRKQNVQLCMHGLPSGKEFRKERKISDVYACAAVCKAEQSGTFFANYYASCEE